MNTFIKNVKKRLHDYFVVLAQKQNNRMISQLLKTQPSALRPQVTLSVLLAYLVSTVVHLIGVLLLIVGLRLVIVSHSNPFALLVAFMCLGIAWLMRPQFGKVPKDYLTQAQAPTLYEFVNKVAALLHAPPIDCIVIRTDYYNASFGLVGLPPKHVLTLGIPLWNTLTPRERVAIIGHELAHNVNGDSSRGYYIGTAMYSLFLWADLVRPRPLFARRGSVVMLPFNLLYYVLWLIARFTAFGLTFLFWNTARRAEYLADYFASTVAGTEATMVMLGKLYYSRSYNLTVRLGMYDAPAEIQSRLNQFYAQINSISLEALESINTPTDEEISRLDLNHPPIGFRMKLLKAHPVQKARAQLSEEQVDKIRAEMQSHVDKQNRLRSVYDEDFSFQPSKRQS